MTDQTAAQPKAPAAAEPTEQLRQIQAFMRAPVPRLYANGVATASTASDIAVILLAHGTPTGILNMSYITAKSFAHDLNNAVSQFEEATGQKIKTIPEVASDLSRSLGNKK